MLVKDFKKGRSARTAARKAGHLDRIVSRWSGHEPPASTAGISTQVPLSTTGTEPYPVPRREH